MKSADTLTWLDAHDANVMAHDGAAFAERELLRLMLGGAAGTGGVMSAAYRALLTFELPDLTGRATVRAYAHEVMFGADFGLDPITVPTEIGGLLDEAVVIHQEDTDTLGELLIAAALIGHTSLATTEAKAVFDAAWQALPRDTFDQYHPILVGGILYALTGE